MSTSAILEQLERRRGGFVPEWAPAAKGPDAALLEAFARFLDAVRQRYEQSLDKNKLAFLDLLGIGLIPAQSARAVMVFRLTDNAADTRIPAGTRLSAPPPPEVNDQIIFETARDTGLAAAKLQEVVSLWPGRDEWIDHSTAFAAGQSFTLFEMARLEPTPHALYLAHDTLLALSGKSNVDVNFDLTTAGSSGLRILWQYWDGQVWRDFMNTRPACLESAALLDGTAGLTRSGAFHLAADCAQSSKTAVNGTQAFWIRGVLDETLPPDPARILPEVDKITIGTQVAQPIQASWLPPKSTVMKIGRIALIVQAQDTAGTPLSGVVVTVSGGTGTLVKVTDASGIVTFDQHDLTGIAATDATVSLAEFQGTAKLLNLPGQTQAIAFTLKLQGLKPDQAYADGVKLEVTKPFYPLGQQPQPGTSFYFSSAEIFSKPGANFRVYVQGALAPTDQLDITGVDSDGRTTRTSTRLPHALAWEYWNGREWSALAVYANVNPALTDPRDFSGTGFITFQVPLDLAATKVNDQDALWMRVRLNSGSFGFTQTVTWQDSQENTNTFTYVIAQPPAISAFQLGYTWEYGPFHCEHVLTYNDFQYVDRTEESKWPGSPYQPYYPPADVTPALYLGFDKPLPEDRLSLFFDVEEQRGDTDGPALEWSYWDGIAWQRFLADDETHNLRVPGLVSFIAPDDMAALARFSTPRYWLRARLAEDGPPGEPVMDGIYSNAVWAIQQQTLTNDSLGKSTAQPNQVFSFRQYPVLAGEQVEVQEISGARANVEWRNVAAELFPNDPDAIDDLDDRLSREGAQTDIQKGPLRLRRDRNKHVTEVWVTWNSRPHFHFSVPEDRDYVVDRARGKLFFGDGDRGRIPPLGAAIQASKYVTGGGTSGNVGAGAIKQALTGIPGLDSVFNPRPAEGGADTESLQALSLRGPQTVRHRGRAVSASDYETFAREASPAVAWSRVLPGRDPSGAETPGWVSVLILPASKDPRPFPSFGLREEVRRYIEASAGADVADAHRIYVTAPDFALVDVTATIVPLDPAQAGAVEQNVHAALDAFFDAVSGGPAGNGWDLGRSVFLSDVASVIEVVAGVDYVKELALLVNGGLAGESVRVPADRVAAAGKYTLKLLES